ncbi:MAG: hypothetical protein ABSG64_14285 [Solirubrobacteraceae bacterium]|jgi:hypothetical protein
MSPSRDAQEALANAFTDAGFTTGRATIAEHDVMVARRSDFRLRWLATRIHTFIIVFSVDELNPDGAAKLTRAAQDYAIEHKGGVPHGLQTGTATIPVFLSPHANDATESWFAQAPKLRFAALGFPVLANLEAETVTYFTGRWKVGGIYKAFIVGIVSNTIAPALATKPLAQEARANAGT